jgi:uncharacterized Tic20 family protein
MSTPPSPPGSPAPPLSDADARTWAIVAHVGGIVTSVVAPLLVYLIFRDRHSYLTDQAREALNFQITVLIALVITVILTPLTFGIAMVLTWGVEVANLVLCIMAAVAASRNDVYRYPFAWRPVS